MALLLLIDTATDTGTVSIANNDNVLSTITNGDAKTHGSFLQPAIQQILTSNNLAIKDIDAVVVVNGPGSYTGLRVGLASAKGLCYALQKPLITFNTLEIMALAAIKKIEQNNQELLFCPMIDARRMEVFTALYNNQLQEIVAPCAMVLDEDSFAKHLKSNTIYFLGNGSTKFQPLANNTNAYFVGLHYKADDIAFLAYNKFHTNKFDNLFYAEPFYLKEFYQPSKI